MLLSRSGWQYCCGELQQQSTLLGPRSTCLRACRAVRAFELATVGCFQLQLVCVDYSLRLRVSDSSSFISTCLRVVHQDKPQLALVARAVVPCGLFRPFT
jgi:hypothetical protein